MVTNYYATAKLCWCSCSCFRPYRAWLSRLIIKHVYNISFNVRLRLNFSLQIKLIIVVAVSAPNFASITTVPLLRLLVKQKKRHRYSSHNYDCFLKQFGILYIQQYVTKYFFPSSCFRTHSLCVAPCASLLFQLRDHQRLLGAFR